MVKRLVVISEKFLGGQFLRDAKNYLFSLVDQGVIDDLVSERIWKPEDFTTVFPGDFGIRGAVEQLELTYDACGIIRARVVDNTYLESILPKFFKRFGLQGLVYESDLRSEPEER